jgi:pimeloyl-ACP methyl ester carboxylesterase
MPHCAITVTVSSQYSTLKPAQGEAVAMYAKIGGIEQWIQIGGENRDNPALLFLHGGPSGSSRAAAAAWRAWETVVHWDQRGAGLTFSKNGEMRCGHLTVEQMINDGIEVAEFLRSHLQKDKIVLVDTRDDALMNHIDKAQQRCCYPKR